MADPIPPSRGSLLSPTPFPLAPETVGLITRCGAVLSRFWRAAARIEQRSLRGSLPPWISTLTRKGTTSSQPNQNPCQVRFFQASFRLLGTGSQISLTNWQLRGDGISEAALLQETSAKSGNQLIGSPQGILDGLLRSATAGQPLIFSAHQPQPSPESDWLLARCGPGAISFQTEEDGPLRLENRIWPALLWSAPLQSVWARELRASNLHFLRSLLPMSWAVDPTPLPHQAVLPGLGERSFADATMPDPDESGRDWILQPNRRHPDPSPVIRSRVSDSRWRETLDRALTDFELAPWLLQQRPAFIGLPITLEGRQPETGRSHAVTGEPELQVYYFDEKDRVTTAGVMVRLRGTPGTPGPENTEGEAGTPDSLLAPCSFIDPVR